MDLLDTQELSNIKKLIGSETVQSEKRADSAIASKAVPQSIPENPVLPTNSITEPQNSFVLDDILAEVSGIVAERTADK